MIKAYFRASLQVSKTVDWSWCLHNTAKNNNGLSESVLAPGFYPVGEAGGKLLPQNFQLPPQNLLQ